MRLFIAVNFEEPIKDVLAEAVRGLKARALRGRFSLRENLHLTLVFIGETNRVKEIIQVMGGIHSEQFMLTTGKPGCFRRPGGGIYWLGIEQNARLARIYSELSNNLKEKGVELDTRDFKPHLTLGRQVVLPEDFCLDIPPMKIEVREISLMKSERINGRLVYTEIYAKELMPIRSQSDKG